MKVFNPKQKTDYPECPCPVGERCLHCEEPIAATDTGFMVPYLDVPGASDARNYDKPFHFECFLRGIVGSVGHQLKQCSCYGGTREDPEGYTKRQAAVAAVEAWARQRQ